MLFRSLGFVVDLASDPGQAENILYTGKTYDFVFIDWKMPAMDGIRCAQHLINRYNVPLSSIIMMTAFGRESLLEKLNEAGLKIKSLVTKPVTFSSLIDGIVTISGGSTTRKENTASTRQKQYREKLEGLSGAHLLLVEDNEFNQELAFELLTAQGLSIEVANDGIEALEMIKQSTYDGILMDCQMPNMDGYEATREIRKQTIYKNLPIIAMTANVTKGDIENAMQAGMNDCISKPINVKDMFTTIAKWIVPSNPEKPPVLSSVAPDSAENNFPELQYIDTKKGLACVDGKKQTYQRLLKKFIKNQSHAIEKLRAALSSNNKKKAIRIAHTLKGVAGSIEIGRASGRERVLRLV